MARKTTKKSRRLYHSKIEELPYVDAKRGEPMGNAPKYDSEKKVIVCPKCGSTVSIEISGKFMCTNIECDWWRWIAGKDEHGENQAQNTQMPFVW